MSKRKLKFGWFTIAQWKEEEAWLRKQRLNGWAFVSFAPPCFYTFRQCEPEDVVYQLDYNQEGAKGKADYIQMFRDCGWEYLTDSMGYSYFCKPASQMKEPEEIFCDDQSRLDMIHRVFKGRMVPLLIIFFCLIVPQLFHTYDRASDDVALKVIFYLYVSMFVIYLTAFIRFAISYWSLKNNMRQ